MANFTMFTSLLASDKERKTFQAPLYHAFKLFSTNCRGNSIDTYVECDTFNTDKYKGVPYLDVTSVYSKETNTVFVNVVNRHKDKTIAAEITNSARAFTGKAQVSLLTAASLDEPFAFDKREQYKPVVKEANLDGNKISCSFPPHSFTQIQVKVAQQTEVSGK
jgi:alpha-N-arabinofuranosidase